MTTTEEVLDLAAIQARADAATAGPWVYGDDRNGEGNKLHPWNHKYSPIADFEFTEDGDAEFIAHAREDVPALLARVRTLVEERDEIKESIAYNDFMMLSDKLESAERKIRAAIKGAQNVYDKPGQSEYTKGVAFALIHILEHDTILAQPDDEEKEASE